MLGPLDKVARVDTAVGEHVGDDFIVVDLRSGRLFGLGEVGGFIWTRLTGETDLTSIAEAVSEHYGIPSGVAREDVAGFASELLERELCSRNSI